MSRKKEAEALKIEYVFPEDYEIMNSSLNIQNGRIKIIDCKENLQEQNVSPSDEIDIAEIYIRPEYELYYKLQNKMNLSDKEPININQLADKNNSSNNALCYRSNTKYEWKDFLLQFPGINKMLGIESKYDINNFGDVIQNPKYAILLIYYRMYWIKPGYKSSYQMQDLCEEIISNYKNNQKNQFNKEKRERFYSFLCRDEESEDYGDWYEIAEKREKIEKEIKKLTKKILKECDANKKIEITYEKGNTLLFPEHLRTIMLGFHDYYASWLYSIYDYEKEDQKYNLWIKYSETVIDESQNKETEIAFHAIINFMNYRYRIKNFDVNHFYEYNIEKKLQEWEIQYNKSYNDLQKLIYGVLSKIKKEVKAGHKENNIEDLNIEDLNIEDLNIEYARNLYDDLRDKCQQPLHDLSEFLDKLYAFFKSTRPKEKKDSLIEEIQRILQGNTYLREIEAEIIKNKEKERFGLVDDNDNKSILEKAESICLFLRTNNEKLINQCKDIISNTIVCEEKYLIGYYTICFATLNRVNFEDKYPDVARYNFERLFSLYLFKQETDLIYSAISNGAEESETCEMAEFVMQGYAVGILNSLYCSPGIFHRVSLSEYIIKKMMDVGRTAFDEFKKYTGEDCVSGRVVDKLKIEIGAINQKYYQKEKNFIRSECKDDTEIQEIIQILNNNKFKDECKPYREFYTEINVFMDQASEASQQRKDKNKILNKKTVEKAVKNYLKKDDRFRCDLYRHIHFWVIFSSLCFENGAKSIRNQTKKDFLVNTKENSENIKSID